MPRKAAPMMGKAFGSLKVIRETTTDARNRTFDVECQNCGEVFEKSGGNIRRAERTAAAGCRCSSKARTHGLSSHPAYKTWDGMMARCHNPKHVAFPEYGGRGIEVCPEWRANPTAFLDWIVSRGWYPGLQIDRIDNNAGYSPENCRIADRTTNQNNRRCNRRLDVDGISMTISEASRRFGIGKTTIKERLNRGWSDADAVRPVNHVS